MKDKTTDEIIFIILFCVEAFGEKASEKLEEVIKELENEKK